MKTKYLFEFRTLADPPGSESFEAGPFTEEEATEYGESQTFKLCEVTDKAWVGRWSPVVVPPKPPMSKHLSSTIFLVSVVTIAVALVYLLARVAR